MEEKHRFIPVNTPLFAGREKEYLCECIDSGWISSEGRFVKLLEEQSAALCRKKFGIAVTNGTAALEAAVRSLKLPAGSEIILPSFTIISCASAIYEAGCVPVPVDCDPQSWNMIPELVREAATSRTRAVMAVHIYGLPCDMKSICAIAREHGWKVIEDLAEAIGLDCDGQPCGSFADVSAMSFYPNKHVTAGEGGMVVTSDPGIADFCRSYRNLCFRPERRFVHYELGKNLRMSNLQAAVGAAQFEYLDRTVERKRAMGRRYQELLAEVPGIQLPLPRTPQAENIYWVFGMVLEDSVGFDAAHAIAELAGRSVGCRPFFYPIHRQPVFLERGLFKNARCPNSERLAERGFYIPSGLGMSEEEMEYCAAMVKEILKHG